MSRCTVRDVSISGAMLGGRTRARPGTVVGVDLEIPGIPKLAVNGRVIRLLRTSTARRGFAIEFASPCADTQALIADLAAMGSHSDQHATVLIVERSPRKRQLLARALYERGWRVVTAEMPLQALEAIDQTPGIEWILVGEQLSQTTGIELLRHVGVEHRHVKRALIASGARTKMPQAALASGLVAHAFAEPLEQADLDKIDHTARPNRSDMGQGCPT